MTRSRSVASLGPDGSFARRFDWFAVRNCQLEMAEAVEYAIGQRTNLVAESGTGTGKTFAYLVPPLSSGKKVVVATRTKSLQDQLYEKDVKWVQQALSLKLDIQLYKGRSNYLCLYRYENSVGQADLFGDQNKLERLYDWVQDQGGSGDLSNYSGLRADERTKLTATAQNCLGSQCEFVHQCYANAARRKAAAADVVIVNHHLLCLNFPDQSQDGGSGLFDSADVIVVDEAHRFPDTVAETQGVRISHETLTQYCDDLLQTSGVENFDGKWIHEACADIKKLTAMARTHLPSDRFDCNITQLEQFPEFIKTFKNIINRINEIGERLSNQAEFGSGVAKQGDIALTLADSGASMFERHNQDSACWIETYRTGFRLSDIPLNPNKFCAPRIQDFDGSFVFTSATLSVDDDFSLFQERLGLSDAVTLNVESPFDYRRQALLYLPQNMPAPQGATRDDYDIAVAKVIEELAPVTEGRLLSLFTSYQSLETVYRYLEDRLDFTLLKQGQASAPNLLASFREDGNAVLLGTSTFWEGIDIKGPELSCVVIAKLPFIPPNDPLLQAREEQMKQNGQNIFMQWQVPNAVLSLKQGAGRLIRDIHDRGLLVLCDSRVKTRHYGQIFLDSLPPLSRTDALDDVRQFFGQ